MQKRGKREFTRNHRNQIHEEEITFTTRLVKEAKPRLEI
jgi:hypothetical protein